MWFGVIFIGSFLLFLIFFGCCLYFNAIFPGVLSLLFFLVFILALPVSLLSFNFFKEVTPLEKVPNAQIIKTKSNINIISLFHVQTFEEIKYYSLGIKDFVLIKGYNFYHCSPKYRYELKEEIEKSITHD